MSFAAFIAEEYQALAIHDPRAQMKVQAPVWGPRIMEHPWVPDGDTGWTGTSLNGMVVLPMYNRYGERTGLQALKQTPFYTRYSLGMIEAARDRRRHRG